MDKRLSGVLCHPTSFPSSFGIGDLGDGAYLFIDFLKRSNQKLWQVLPLGPTSFGDSPYQSFSSFAGNTLLISPHILLKDGLLNDNDLIDDIINNPRSIDYGEIIILKDSIYRKAFKNHNQENKKYLNFCKANKEWLDDYALFISLKKYFIEERRNNFDENDYNLFKNKYIDLLDNNILNDYYFGAVWSTWPKDIAKRSKDSIIYYSKLLINEINYNKFLQYCFFTQWNNLKKYANNEDIKIIGDIPIFVAYDSCDVWSNQEIFQLDNDCFPLKVAGVPPDYFSSTGQLWGNPLYDWDKNKETNYKWWIKRIKCTLNFVDILRIDHFRGFDTFWEIPFGSENAINGKWIKGPANKFFKEVEKALGKLPIIAEDLGEPSTGTEKLRLDFDFPGMKILQFAFDDDSNNDYLPHNFKNDNFVIYSGTHDNDTTIGWYKNASVKAKDYYRKYMNVSGEDVSWDLIRLCFASVAKYAIITIQDIMNLDENDRMNTPGKASGNWQFRFTQDMLNEDYTHRLKYLSILFNRN